MEGPRMAPKPAAPCGLVGPDMPLRGGAARGMRTPGKAEVHCGLGLLLGVARLACAQFGQPEQPGWMGWLSHPGAQHSAHRSWS